MTRIEKLQAHFPENVDAFITSDEKTCFYLSEFLFSDGMLFITKNNAYLFTDFRYIEAAESEARGCKLSVANRYEEIRKIIGEEDIKTIGFEDDLLSVMMLDRYKKEFSSCTFSPMGGVVRTLAEYKDTHEMELVRGAQAITDEAFASVLTLLRPDMTETDVAAELEYQMKKRGASGTSFDTIAVSGTNSARPHGVPRPVILEAGFLTMDFGCIWHGYCSDMTRTFFFGAPDDGFVDAYAAVLKANLAAEEGIRTGMECSAADKIARDVLEKKGYKAAFTHTLGHGIGTRIHEYPTLGPKSAGKLKSGMVFSIEPGVYFDGKYGVRIEDTVVLKGGVKRLFKDEKNLILID